MDIKTIGIPGLKRKRKALKDMTQEKLASRVNCSVRQLSRLETGQADPSMDLLRRIMFEVHCSSYDEIMKR